MRKKLFLKYYLSLGFGVAVAFLCHSTLMASDDQMDPEKPFYRALSEKLRMNFDGSARSKENLIKAAGELTELRLGNKRITVIPDSIGNLVNLRVLDFSRNKLKTLPDSIGKLVNLEFLFLAINKLETLPDSIRNLTQFKEINAGNNDTLNITSKMLLCGLVIETNDFGPCYTDLRRLDNMTFEEIFYSVYNNRKEVIALVNQNLTQHSAEEVVPETTHFGPRSDAHKINIRLRHMAIRKGIPAEFFREQ